MSTDVQPPLSSTEGADPLQVDHPLERVGTSTKDWGVVRSAVVALVRWSPLIAVVGLLGMTAVVVIDDSVGTEPVAVVQLGVTDEVGWPFYDVVREGAVSAAESDDVLAAIEAALGDDFVDHEVSQPDGLLLIDLTVEATSDAAADEGARLAGQIVVDALLAEKVAGYDAEIVVLSEGLAGTEARIVELDAEFTAALDRYEAADGPGEVGQAENDVSRIRLQLDNVEREAIELEQDITDAERAKALVEPEVEVVGFEAAASASSNAWLVALAVGVGAALATSIVVVGLTRERGRIRSGDQVHAAFGVPVVGLASTDDVSPALVRVLQIAREDGHGSIAVDLAPAMEGPPKGLAVAAGVASVGGSAGVDVDSSTGPVKLVDLGGSDLYRLGRCRAVVVVAARHRTTMRWLRRRVAEHEAADLEMIAVIVT